MTHVSSPLGRWLGHSRDPLVGALGWAVLLLCSVAQAQLTVLPSPGKSLGAVTAPEPGKWVVFAKDFMPVQPTLVDGGKTILWEGAAGDYAIIYFPPGDGQPVVQKVTLGGSAPEPKPPDPPAPNHHWQIAIFVETGDLDGMPLAQLEMVASLAFRKSLTEAGHTFLGVWDKDSAVTGVRCADGRCIPVEDSKYAPWFKAAAGKPLPCVAIASPGGGDIQVFPLPADAAALLKLLAEAK